MVIGLTLFYFQKTTTRQPDSSSERDPPQLPRENVPEVKEDSAKPEPESVPKNDKPIKDRDEGIGMVSLIYIILKHISFRRYFTYLMVSDTSGHNNTLP